VGLGEGGSGWEEKTYDGKRAVTRRRPSDLRERKKRGLENTCSLKKLKTSGYQKDRRDIAAIREFGLSGDGKKAQGRKWQPS